LVETNVSSAQEPEARRLSGAMGVDWASDYYFRGIVQETEGLIVQPSAETTFTAYAGEGTFSGLSIGAGVWASMHRGPTGNPDMQTVPHAWYEADFHTSVAAQFFGGLDLSMNYTAYMSPNGSFATVHEIGTSVSYSDSDLWHSGWFEGVSPSLTLATEVDGTAFGDNPGTYLEAAISPSVLLLRSSKASVRASLPLVLGTSLEDYYGSFFGFFSAGLTAELGMDFIPVSHGQWSVAGTLSMLTLGSDLKAANDGDRLALTGTLGLHLQY
jgi:hypothetical protein